MTDSKNVSLLPEGTPMIILNPTGEITVWANINEAVKRVNEGGTVIVADGALPDVLSRIAIEALNKAYLAGNKDLYIQFNESSGTTQAGIFLIIDKNIITETMPDGRIIAPVVRLPKHYILYRDTTNNPQQYPPLLNLEQNEYWINQIIKDGYKAISMRQN
jgi:hypothetical protein